MHVYHDEVKGTDDKSDWKSYARKYTIGTIEVPGRYVEYGKNRILYELSTGAIDMTKKNNIYDLAGNMWEWTTETGEHKIKDANGNIVYDENGIGMRAVRRGGNFVNNGLGHPVAHRLGDSTIDSIGDINVGFRVVLYITK